MKPDDGHLDLERLKLADAPELHRALGALKQQLPDARQLAALAASLSSKGLPVSQPRAALTNPLSSATRLKLMIGAGAVGALTLAVMLRRAEAPRSLLPVDLTASVPHSSPAIASAEAERDVAPAFQGPRHTVVDANSDDSPRKSAPPASSPPSEAMKDVLEPKNETAPAARVAAGTASSKPSAARVRPATTTGTTDVSNLAPGVVARPTELALLRDARIALRTNPSEALALAEQHRALFAQGAMVQERELIAITALARLGRHTAVLARAAQFERDFPASPYRQQIVPLAQ